MGFLTKLKGLIFGSPKIIDNVFDSEKGLLTQVGSWIGGQQFTAEEKAEHMEALGKGVREFAVATMSENTERSKTRRRLALKWFDLQILLIKIQVIFFTIDAGVTVLSDDGKGLGLSAAFSTIAFNGSIWAITSGIGLFFWGSHMLRSSKFAKEEKQNES